MIVTKLVKLSQDRQNSKITNYNLLTLKQSVILSVFVVLCALTKVRLSKTQYHGGYEMENNYGGSHPLSAYGRYDNHGGHGNAAQSIEEVDERPKVQLGVRLKIPAIRFELPRVNLPKITVSAKIRQPDGPRVISLPEINFDTSSKVEPPGAQAATSGQKEYYSSQNTNYAAKQKPYYVDERNESPRPSRPYTDNYSNQYRTSHYGGQSHSSTNSSPSYWSRNQYQYNNNNNNNDADLGFNSPVYVVPGAQPISQYTRNSHQTPMNNRGFKNLMIESGGRYKRSRDDLSHHYRQTKQ